MSLPAAELDVHACTIACVARQQIHACSIGPIQGLSVTRRPTVPPSAARRPTGLCSAARGPIGSSRSTAGRQPLVGPPQTDGVAVELDKRGVACRRCSVKRLSDQWNRPADFSAINPSYANKRNRFIYTGAASFMQITPIFPFDSVVMVDDSNGSATRWSSEGRKFVREPVFIPTGGGEDHVYVILVEYAVSKDRCHLVVLDARKIGKRGALVAKLQLPKHLTLPMGFHGLSADE